MTKYKKGQTVKGLVLLEATFKHQKHGGRWRRHAAWICQLDSGEKKVICEKDITRRTGAPGPLQARINLIYRSYRDRCKLRNIFWNLTIGEFFKLSQMVCTYCGVPPSNKAYAPFIYNGIDRKENEKGYSPKNSVSCCARCNQVKGSILSFEEMRVGMQAIVRWKKRR